MRLLIERGAAVNPKGARPDSTPVFAASMSGNVESLSLLFENGANLDHRSAVMGTSSMTPLANAVMSHNVDMVRVLVQHGADVNELDSSKMTPLMFAALFHDGAIVRALLELGADPDRVESVRIHCPAPHRRHCLWRPRRSRGAERT